MSSQLRWRIMTLQAALVLAFAFSAGFMFWASGYVQSTIRDQMAAQQINFPQANDPGITPAALTPCGALATNTTCPIPTSHAIGVSNSNAMKQYAGQPLTSGAQAEIYANDYINVHLSDMGKTYEQASSLAMLHPNDTAMVNLADTIFKGTTLRGMLLNAYGWWTVGDYTADAAYASILATLVVLGAFLFELFLAVRKTAVEPAARTVGQAQLQPSIT
jgi:hypothetical protein